MTFSEEEQRKAEERQREERERFSRAYDEARERLLEQTGKEPDEDEIFGAIVD